MSDYEAMRRVVRETRDAEDLRFPDPSTEGVAGDADDGTDPALTCTHRRKPLWPGQKPAKCTKPYGHWPASDHRWTEEET